MLLYLPESLRRFRKLLRYILKSLYGSDFYYYSPELLIYLHESFKRILRFLGLSFLRSSFYSQLLVSFYDLEYLLFSKLLELLRYSLVELLSFLIYYSVSVKIFLFYKLPYLSSLLSINIHEMFTFTWFGTSP